MPAPSCRLQLDGDQKLEHSNYVALRWASPAAYETTDREGCPPEVWDEGGFFDPLHPERLTVPADGRYLLWLSPKFGDKDLVTGATRRKGRRAWAYSMNDGNRDIVVSLPADPGGTTTLPTSPIPLALLAGEHVVFWLEQQSGGTINAEGASATGGSAKDTTAGLEYLGPLLWRRKGGK